jgi:hypothetical protein
MLNGALRVRFFNVLPKILAFQWLLPTPSTLAGIRAEVLFFLFKNKLRYLWYIPRGALPLVEIWSRFYKTVSAEIYVRIKHNLFNFEFANVGSLLYT